MSRLADRIIQYGVRPPGHAKITYQEAAAVSQKVQIALRDAEIVAADNVCEYFFACKEDWNILDFPCLAPPFEMFFVEMCRPYGVLMDGLIERVEFVPAWGILFAIDQELDAKSETDPKWKVSAFLFLEREKGHIVGPITHLWLTTDKRGNVSDARISSPYRYEADTEFIDKMMYNMVVTHMYPALLTVSFLHCKNVIYEDAGIPPALAKSYAKKHKHPRIRFHTLEIEPMKQVLRREGHSDVLGLKKALHICRGHFKDYREKGLFGKLRGIYWWDSFVRGSGESGVVLKDYDVKLPEVFK